jgi:hypothetical protein
MAGGGSGVSLAGKIISAVLRCGDVMLRHG